MVRTHEIRLYPTPMQEVLLDRWCVLASRIYNAALEERVVVYRNEGRSLSYYDQCKELTDIRACDREQAELPVGVARDALRKLDRSFKAFFRRVKAGQTPGFPRFKSARRWRSFEILAAGNYVKEGKVRVPKLGLIR